MIDLDTDSWQWHDNLHSWRRPFTMSVPFRIKVDLMHTQNKAPNWWKHSVGKISQKSDFSWNNSSRKSRFWIIKKSPLNPLNKDPKVWNVPVRTYTKMAAIHHGFLFGWLFSMLFLWLRRLRRRPLWRRDFSVSIKVLALALQWETGGRGDIGSSCHLPAGRHFLATTMTNSAFISVSVLKCRSKVTRPLRDDMRARAPSSAKHALASQAG